MIPFVDRDAEVVTNTIYDEADRLVREQGVDVENLRWVQLEGFSRYLVSNLAHIFDTKRRRLLRLTKAPTHFQVRLLDDEGKAAVLRAHRILAAAFLGLDLRDSEMVVWPWNGDYFDLRLENLRVGTQSEYRQWTIARPDGVPAGERIAAALGRLHFKVEVDEVREGVFRFEVDLSQLVKKIERQLEKRGLGGSRVEYDSFSRQFFVYVEGE